MFWIAFTFSPNLSHSPFITFLCHCFVDMFVDKDMFVILFMWLWCNLCTQSGNNLSGPLEFTSLEMGMKYSQSRQVSFIILEVCLAKYFFRLILWNIHTLCEEYWHPYFIAKTYPLEVMSFFTFFPPLIHHFTHRALHDFSPTQKEKKLNLMVLVGFEGFDTPKGLPSFSIFFLLYFRPDYSSFIA